MSEIVFDDTIADMLSNKKLNSTVTDLFIRFRKLIITLNFITQSYFAVPKNIRPNSAQYFILKIPNKQVFQQIAFSHYQILTIKTLFIFTKNVQQNQ